MRQALPENELVLCSAWIMQTSWLRISLYLLSSHIWINTLCFLIVISSPFFIRSRILSCQVRKYVSYKIKHTSFLLYMSMRKHIWFIEIRNRFLKKKKEIEIILFSDRVSIESDKFAILSDMHDDSSWKMAVVGY